MKRSVRELIKGGMTERQAKRVVYGDGWLREQTHLDNAKRAEAKRAWDRENATDCLECGVRLANPRITRCLACQNEALRNEARRRICGMVELRAQGLTNKEIALKLGITQQAVAGALYRAKKYDVPVPRSPYWDRAT